MEHRIFHQCDSLVVEYDVLADYLCAIWARDQTPTTIVEGYERILFYLQREHCQKLLDNHEAIHGYWADSADWLSQNWYPRAREAGLKNHAVVFATDVLARRSTEEALRGITSGSVAGFVNFATAQQELLDH